MHSGAELDFLVVRGQRRVGFEFKPSSAPELTTSMTTAADELGLERLWGVHAGKQRYLLRNDIEALPVRDVATAIARW